MKIDWSINIGQIIAGILTSVMILTGGFFAYAGIESRISAIDQRTSDYLSIRDIALANNFKIESLQAALLEQSSTNKVLLAQLAAIQSDIAVINVTLKVQRGQ